MTDKALDIESHESQIRKSISSDTEWDRIWEFEVTSIQVRQIFEIFIDHFSKS